MRAGFWKAVVPCALLALACQGAKGDKGDKGDQGDQGIQGTTGTFSGTTSSPVTFSGGATISGGTAINGALTINGQDLLAASMAGLAPAVFGYLNGVGAGHLSCAAPTALDLSATISTGTASYGELIYTSQGIFNVSQGSTAVTTCATVCVGPLTFFLVSPSAQTIVLQGYLDNGPSRIYIDGTAQAPLSGTINQGVNVPAGPFALSIVSCSSDGFSAGMYMSNPWISTYNLSIDIDRTFHRNGK